MITVVALFDEDDLPVLGWASAFAVHRDSSLAVLCYRTDRSSGLTRVKPEKADESSPPLLRAAIESATRLENRDITFYDCRGAGRRRAVLGAAGELEARQLILGSNMRDPESKRWGLVRRLVLSAPLEVLVFDHGGVPPTSTRTVVPQVEGAGAHAIRYAVQGMHRVDGEVLVGQEIRIDGLGRLQIDVMVRLAFADGWTHSAILRPASPSLRHPGQRPSRSSLLPTYLTLGVEHILGGVDHLLFVLGLLFLVRDRWMLVKTITSFTIAHSITLAIATLGYAQAPVDALNVLIAMSILFLGPEIVRRVRGQRSLTIDHPWIVAFAFGLLHGFGFASGLLELGLPRSEIPLALLMFNVGVEIGQLGFVAILLAVGASLGALGLRGAAWTSLVPAYIIGSLGAYWTIDRLVAALI
jgi:hypothetical protein